MICDNYSRSLATHWEHSDIKILALKDQYYHCYCMYVKHLEHAVPHSYKIDVIVALND